MENEMNYEDIQAGLIGFVRTCFLFISAHFISGVHIIYDFINPQNIAYLATTISGFANVYILWRKNKKTRK